MSTVPTSSPQPPDTCSLCAQLCGLISHDAWPLASGRACSHCHERRVIPLRLELLQRWKFLAVPPQHDPSKPAIR
jgi:hypothetical protein